MVYTEKSISYEKAHKEALRLARLPQLPRYMNPMEYETFTPRCDTFY